MPSSIRFVLCLAVLLPPSVAAQTIADDTGLTALAERIGAVPTGFDVIVGQVEAQVGSAYAPDPTHPEFAGKTITTLSPGSGTSGHATTVGQHFFGLATGIAPGPTDVRSYSVTHWAGSGFLNGSGTLPPLGALGLKIFNHSWVGSLVGANMLLRKSDQVVDSQEVVMVCGMNNGVQPLTSVMMAHAFNTISVGRSDGNHESGTTTLVADGPGRMKPELVAPGSATSFATPLVGGAAALLVETARTWPGLVGAPAAERAMLLKAVLMAGAEKRAGWSNGAPSTGPARGATTTPLDPLWGADEIDVNQSHWVLTSLEQSGSATHTAPSVGQRGWDVLTIEEGESAFWRFDVSVQKPTVDAVLCWNRLVPANFNGFFLADLDLFLWRVDASDQLVSLVGDGGVPFFASGNVESTSAVDNVELLHLTDLAPGPYALEVRRAVDFSFLSTEVALAWSMTCPAPTTYCTAKVASAGCLPSIDAAGFASAADPNPFVIRAQQIVNNKNGLVFYGFAPAAIPFLDGTLCVQPPLRRTDIQPSSGNPPPDDCSGTYTFDMRALIQSGLDPFLVPGVGVYAQYWFRDPVAASGTGLTDAVTFSICQ